MDQSNAMDVVFFVRYETVLAASRPCLNLWIQHWNRIWNIWNMQMTCCLRFPAGRIAEQSAGIQYHEAVVK